MTFATATKGGELHLGPVPDGSWVRTFCGRFLRYNGYRGTPDWCETCETAFEEAE